MHDESHPHCADCLHFVLAFHTNSPLADWGYCLLQTGGEELPRERLREIEEKAQQGDLQELQIKELGLFEVLEQTCDKFEHFYPF
jgi:hypothetical protein